MKCRGVKWIENRLIVDRSKRGHSLYITYITAGIPSCRNAVFFRKSRVF
jgi:hypothetical protein